MNNERMLNAIQTQGRELQQRAEWFQKMIERQTQAILNSQATIDHFRCNLQAVNMAIDSLREQYRQLNEGASQAGV